MPWRLIQVIVILAVILLFIGFNLGDDYKCNINIIFKIIPNVPVFLIVFFSFVFGMISTLPFILIHNLRKKHKVEDKKDGAADSPSIPNSNHYGID
jgi:predicted tellurium resistance membrane protein TerC